MARVFVVLDNKKIVRLAVAPRMGRLMLYRLSSAAGRMMGGAKNAERSSQTTEAVL